MSNKKGSGGGDDKSNAGNSNNQPPHNNNKVYKGKIDNKANQLNPSSPNYGGNKDGGKSKK